MVSSLSSGTVFVRGSRRFYKAALTTPPPSVTICPAVGARAIGWLRSGTRQGQWILKTDFYAAYIFLVLLCNHHQSQRVLMLFKSIAYIYRDFFLHFYQEFYIYRYIKISFCFTLFCSKHPKSQLCLLYGGPSIQMYKRPRKISKHVIKAY